MHCILKIKDSIPIDEKMEGEDYYEIKYRERY